ncbi:hypothetical protein F4802DRAFT_338533 [Xylaria palmicola]|nr:hypothetical protein F4802DRAFT_338533 [Xylaria palmicola]
MDYSPNARSTTAATFKRCAQKNLDNLVLNSRHANSDRRADEASIKYKIDFLSAINTVDSAALIDTWCPDEKENLGNVGESLAHKREEALALAKSLVKDADARLREMTSIALRIEARCQEIKKLEQLLKTYENIRKSLRIVLPGDGTTYSYEVDSNKGVSLVIRTPDKSEDKSQARPQPIDLVDSLTLPPISTPALKPVLARPVEQITTAPRPRVAGTKPVEKPPPTVSSPNGNHTVPQEHSSARHERVCQSDDSLPLVFRHGIQYNPLPTLGTHDALAQSRMVIISGLHPSTTWSELLDQVRGGPVLRVAGADATTALVSFVHARDARAYVEYVQRLPRPPAIRGATATATTPRVTLAPTPSYPVRADLLLDMARRGVTRCLVFHCASVAFGEVVEDLLRVRKLWNLTETGRLAPRPGPGSITVSDHSMTESESECTGSPPRSDSESPEEWVVVGHGARRQQKQQQQKQQQQQQHTAGSKVFRVSFRDVAHARYAFGLIRTYFPSCRVSYAPDRCAGPLSELDA